MGRSHFAGDSSPEPKCYFCDESEDHVAIGQGEPKLCSTLHAETLQKCHPMRGSCFQCLFPGAGENTGKHNEGYAKGILYVSINHMTDSQKINMYWYVMGIEMKRKIKISYHCIKIDVFQSNNNHHYFQKVSSLPST